MEKIFNFALGAGIIFGIQYFSLYLLKLLKITFPAPILGIIILFLLLQTNIAKEEYIKCFCNFILKYMILFFIPLFVGIITYGDVILGNFWAIILTIFITTTIVMVAVGVYVDKMIEAKKK